MHLRSREIAVDEQHLLPRRHAGDAKAHGDGGLAFAARARGDEHGAGHDAIVAEGEKRAQPLESPAKFGQRLALDVVARARRQPPEAGQIGDHADDPQPDVALHVLHAAELLAQAFGDDQQQDGERGRADEGERSHPRDVGVRRVERDLRRRDDAGIRLLVVPQRDRLGIALEQILVEVLVGIETLRHLADRRVGLVQVDHLLAQGLEVTAQPRLMDLGAFHLVAQARQGVADLAADPPARPR